MDGFRATAEVVTAPSGRAPARSPGTAAEAQPSPVTPVPGSGRRWRRWRRWRRPRRPLAEYTAAGLAFLALSIGLWWHVWTGHPAGDVACGCGDPSVFVWFMEWPAYALSHGMNPFFSPMVFHPAGMDLLSNTSVLAIGIPLVPVTLAFGPVAALNVALTVTPVLTGLATFWLLRRWVRWTPAAFGGAVVFAFSPFVLSSLEYAHLMTAALAPVPLIVGCLDELLLRHRHRPVPVGVTLAVLLAVQLLVSTEILLMLAVTAAIGVAVLSVSGLAADRRALVGHVRRAAPGLAATAVLAPVLMAYPTWFALAGPAHLSGPVWPGLSVLGGARLTTLVHPVTGAAARAVTSFGGYEGAPLPQATYVGWGLFAVAAGTLVVWRRDRRLWFLAVMAVATTSLMLGVQPGHWVPWQVVGRLPLGDDVAEQRFVVFTLLALCAMLAIGIDRARRLGLPVRADRGRAPWRLLLPPAVVGSAFAGAVVPLAAPFAGTLPYTVRPVSVPAWFVRDGRTVAPGTVVLVYPAQFSGIESPMAWQAIGGMSFVQAGGSGPQGLPFRDGRQRAAVAVLSALSFSAGPLPKGTPAQLAAVRRALRAWGVATVVVPEDADRPLQIGGRDRWYAAAFMTALLGSAPRLQDGAWVWTSVRHDPSPLLVPRGVLAGCAATAASRHVAPAVAACVLAAGAPGARGSE